MGFLDFLFGRRKTPIPDARQLRQALFQAAQGGDVRRLERLCRANRAAVVEQFPGWQKVPEGLRDDPQALQHYMQGLVAVAQTFADRLGSQELLQRLMGSPQDNPLLRWQEGLRQAEALMAELRYAEARQLLSDLLIDARGLRGSGVDTYLPITLGRLGECYFQARRRAATSVASTATAPAAPPAVPGRSQAASGKRLAPSKTNSGKYWCCW
jgi:hypothetical protein